MTRISMIGAIPAVPADEWKDRGKEVPSKPFINYMDLTSGQMSLILLREQMDILGGYYPEARQELLPAIQKIDAALQQGVHNVGYLQSGISQAERLVNYAISKAKNNLRPAGGVFVPRGLQGIGIEVEEFDNGGGGYGTPGPSSNTLPPDVQQDLAKYADLPNCQKIVDQLRRTSGLFDNKKKQALKAELEECYHRENLVKVLNKNLEGSGHHILYNFATPGQTNAYTAVVAKRIQQSGAVNALARISKIEKANLEMWLSNGIMRKNAAGGTKPYQPEETFTIFKEGSIDKLQTGDSKVGFIDPVSFSIIVGAIISAVTAAYGILKDLRNQELLAVENAAGNYGTPEGGPQETDFLSTKDAAGIPGWLLPAGLAAGALALLLGGRD